MSFTPYHNKIEFVPIAKEGILVGNDELLELGTVVAVGRDIATDHDPFVRVGDTIAFVKWGVFETPEVNGRKHYVIECSPEYILGKVVLHGQEE